MSFAILHLKFWCVGEVWFWRMAKFLNGFAKRETQWAGKAPTATILPPRWNNNSTCWNSCTVKGSLCFQIGCYFWCVSFVDKRAIIWCLFSLRFKFKNFKCAFIYYEYLSRVGCWLFLDWVKEHRADTQSKYLTLLIFAVGFLNHFISLRFS